MTIQINIGDVITFTRDRRTRKLVSSISADGIVGTKNWYKGKKEWTKTETNHFSIDHWRDLIDAGIAEVES